MYKEHEVEEHLRKSKLNKRLLALERCEDEEVEKEDKEE